MNEEIEKFYQIKQFAFFNTYIDKNNGSRWSIPNKLKNILINQIKKETIDNVFKDPRIMNSMIKDDDGKINPKKLRYMKILKKDLKQKYGE